MDIRTGLDGLKSLLGVSQTAQATTPPARSGAAKEAGPLSSDSATLSSAGSEAAQSAGDDGVRTDKVASIQAAVEAGTYSVPASAVAAKMVDSMLSGGR